jgi:HSP20 family protein
MANIAVTKENGGQPQAITHREWDPFRAMRELMRWDPFAAMPAWPAEARDVMNVAFDVKETKDGFVFTADVPGIESKDIDVKLQNNRLTISGKREQEKTDKGDTYYSYERSYGSFTRSFTLPEGVDADKISADLKQGVLIVTLPKKPEVKPKQISVKSG